MARVQTVENMKIDKTWVDTLKNKYIHQFKCKTTPKNQQQQLKLPDQIYPPVEIPWWSQNHTNHHKNSLKVHDEKEYYTLS